MKNKKEEEERQAEEADKKQDIVWREQGKYYKTHFIVQKRNQLKSVPLNIHVVHSRNKWALRLPICQLSTKIVFDNMFIPFTNT